MERSSDQPTILEKPTIRRFQSEFTPLNFEGPLPPGITEKIVVSAYKSIGLRPKRVLLTLDIKRFTGAPEKRLRRALDNLSARRGKKQSHGQNLEPFHLALYEWQKNKSQNVFDRIIKPALYEDKGKIFLNPEKFHSLLEKEPRESSIYLSPSIEPDSESEAIAIFGFAFGHLQPEESYDILEPLLSIGTQFREFFGVTEV
jgi:hypothetical protein